jgi:trehalose 6-phosphate phosphatase
VESRRYLVSTDTGCPDGWVVASDLTWPRGFETRNAALRWATGRAVEDGQRGIAATVIVQRDEAFWELAFQGDAACSQQPAANDAPEPVHFGSDGALASRQAGLSAPPIPPPGARVALFLDLDGTLAPIVSRPELVSLDPSQIELIGRLSDSLGGALAVLSGRTLEQIDALVHPLSLAAAGVHGAQLRRTPNTIETTVPADWARAQVCAACAAIELPNGAWLEAKSNLSFAFHYRDAPHQRAWIAQQARSIASKTGGAYTVQFGDCIAEVKPAGVDKGTAMLALMQTPPFSGRMPLMLGDDLTDESAFAEARLWNGRGIIVGDRWATKAIHRLDSPAAVHSWLLALLESLHAGAEEQAT